MNAGILCSILNRFFFRGLEEGVFNAVQTHVVIEEAGYASFHPVSTIGMLSNGGITCAEYLSLLEDGTYSGVFSDGSIIYMECRYVRNSLFEHRYFFVPCPFLEETLLGRPDHIPLGDWLRDSMELEGASCLKSVGAMRFDCVREPPVELENPHPVSHLTFGSGDCRLPLRGPLPVSSFLHFIFDNYFRPLRFFWLDFAPYIQLDDTEVTITAAEMSRHHLNWEPELAT